MNTPPDKHTRCLELLPAFVGGTLPMNAVPALLAHASECVDCGAELDMARRLNAHFARQWSEVQPLLDPAVEQAGFDHLWARISDPSNAERSAAVAAHVACSTRRIGRDAASGCRVRVVSHGRHAAISDAGRPDPHLRRSARSLHRANATCGRTADDRSGRRERGRPCFARRLYGARARSGRIAAAVAAARRRQRRTRGLLRCAAPRSSARCWHSRAAQPLDPA